MEPEIVFLADISDLVDGVERSHNGGAPCSRDKEWFSAICQSLLDPRLQILWDHHTSENPESDSCLIISYFENNTFLWFQVSSLSKFLIFSMSYLKCYWRFQMEIYLSSDLIRTTLSNPIPNSIPALLMEKWL